jgi:hypothetical protein
LKGKGTELYAYHHTPLNLSGSRLAYYNSNIGENGLGNESCENDERGIIFLYLWQNKGFESHKITHTDNLL